MAKTALQIIKGWFATGAYPTEQQFTDAWDSFRHRDDPVPPAEVEGLADALNSKADAATLAQLAGRTDEAEAEIDALQLTAEGLAAGVAAAEGQAAAAVEAANAAAATVATLDGRVTAVEYMVQGALGKFVARRGTDEPYTYTVYDTLAQAFAGEQGQTALITVSADCVLNEPIVISDSLTDITIQQAGGNRTIMRNFSGVMIQLQAGSLTLDGPTLRGTLNGGGAVVYVSRDALLVMASGAITGNDNSAGDGGAVYVFGGTFRMEGGQISGNNSNPLSSGGAVVIYHNNSTARFIMNGGSITGNVGGVYGGGGVRVDSNGVFTYNAGVIASNSTANTGPGTQVKKDAGGVINGSGGVSEASGYAVNYDAWPPQ